MAANYTKREERSAELERAMQEYQRRPASAPPRYACAVCGIEKSDGVPLWALSERGNHTLCCTEHIPEEWRTTPEQLEQATSRSACLNGESPNASNDVPLDPVVPLRQKTGTQMDPKLLS